jgi:hypothetical protein
MRGASDTQGEVRNAYKIIDGISEGKKSLGRSRRRWEDNIEMDVGDLPYRKVGRDARTSGRCSSRGTGSCPSDTTVAPLIDRCVGAERGTPTTRVRGRSSRGALHLEAEGHQTRDDVRQENI